jgi:hypothetical protein
MADDDDIDSFWEGLRPPPKPLVERVRDAVETGLYRFQEEARADPRVLSEGELTGGGGIEMTITVTPSEGTIHQAPGASLAPWVDQQREQAGELAQVLNPFVRHISPPPDEDSDYVPGFEDPEGNMAPRGSGFQHLALQTSQVWFGEIMRNLPRTTTSVALLIRISDAVRLRLVEYSRSPDANIETVYHILQEATAPLVDLIQDDRQSPTPDRNPFTEIGVVNQLSSVAQAIYQERRVEDLLSRIEPTRVSSLTGEVIPNNPSEINVNDGTWVNPDNTESLTEAHLTRLHQILAVLGFPATIQLSRDARTLYITFPRTLNVDMHYGPNAPVQATPEETTVVIVR